MIDSLSSHFRDGAAGLSTVIIVLGAAVVAGVTLSLWRFSQRRSSRENGVYNSPRALFAELCRMHGLDRKSRRLLKKLARRQRLAMPSLLFLEPKRFDVGASPTVNGQQRARLDQLRDRLFGRRLETGER